MPITHHKELALPPLTRKVSSALLSSIFSWLIRPPKKKSFWLFHPPLSAQGQHTALKRSMSPLRLSVLFIADRCSIVLQIKFKWAQKQLSSNSTPSVPAPILEKVHASGKGYQIMFCLLPQLPCFWLSSICYALTPLHWLSRLFGILRLVSVGAAFWLWWAGTSWMATCPSIRVSLNRDKSVFTASLASGIQSVWFFLQFHMRYIFLSVFVITRQVFELLMDKAIWPWSSKVCEQGKAYSEGAGVQNGAMQSVLLVTHVLLVESLHCAFQKKEKGKKEKITPKRVTTLACMRRRLRLVQAH